MTGDGKKQNHHPDDPSSRQEARGDSGVDNGTGEKAAVTDGAASESTDITVKSANNGDQNEADGQGTDKRNGRVEETYVPDVAEDFEEEAEVMAYLTEENIDGRLENLTQSILDLQAKSEAGLDFDSPQTQLRRRGLRKYSNALKTFLPIRPNIPKEILPMSSLGCVNYATYGWVTSIMIRIYRKGVETMNMYRLAEVDTAHASAVRFERIWSEELKKKGPERASFARVCLRANRTRLICTFICMVFFLFFSLLNPIFLIRSFLEYLGQGHIDIRVGIAYVFGMLFCEVLRATFMSMTWMINYQAGARIRAGAMTLLFKKILHLKGLKDKTVGELVNLVGNDSQRIFEACTVGPMVLSGPIAMLAGCAYAIYYLGPWALVGCAIFVGFYPFNTFISKLTTYLRRKCIFATDNRVRVMNELLTCIKLIKMYAWEKPFAQKIADIRQVEKGLLEKGAIVQSISTSTAGMVPVIGSTLTFVAMVSAGNDLTAAEAFSFVALLNSLRFVLGVLPYGIKSIAEASVAVKRFGSVLLMEEMEPQRGTKSKPPDGVAMEIKDATLTWGAAVSEASAAHSDKNGKKQSPNAKPKGGVKGATSEEKQRMLANETTNMLMTGESSGEHATLANISVTLQKGKLLGVCGSVGSGKSSLINAILGRMDLQSGSISIAGSVAYVPQQAWIMNATARENILFGLPHEEERYNRVVEACALTSDFDGFMSGDLTEIGERGINLSGGQKQRISLARAVYSDSDVYLLDDPLSAVDIHIGRHIFTQCIMGALAGKSIVFVTHQLQYLPQCSEVIFVKDGRVLEKGDHQQLMAQQGEYAALMRVYYSEHTTELTNKDEEDGGVDMSSSPPQAALERLISHTSEGSPSQNRVILERGFSVNSKVSKTTEEICVPKAPQATQNAENPAGNGKLIAREEVQKGGIDLRAVLDFMKAAGGYCVSTVVLIIFLLTVISLNASSVILSYWLSQGSGNTTIEVGNVTMISPSITDHPQLMTFTLVYGLSVVVMVLLLLLRAVIFMKATLVAASRIHDDVFAKILRCPMSFFDTTPLGRIVNRFSGDMDEVDVRLPTSVEVFITNILQVLFAVGLIAYVAPYFVIALVPLIIVFVIMYRIFTSTIRDLKRLDMVSRAPLLSHITATVQGISTIYAYGKADDFLKKYCRMLDTNTVPYVMFFIANRWLALRLDLISAFVTGITALIIVLTYESLTPAMAGLALSSALQMTGLFQFTVRLAIETEARFTSVHRVLDYSKTIEPEAALVIPDTRPHQDWPKKGAMVFNKVEMRYREGLPLTLKGVSFKVNPQEKIGIVGRTGSGKSTLGVALFRLVELAGGSITIDDLDISLIGLEDLRSKLSIIPQDPVLFVGTVRYNLDPFNQHSEADLWAALEKCHIKDSIAALEQKLEAPVVENGENFSVGERQLLCMARALLRHSKILMLDEATAAIDTETDSLVQATLKGAFWDCTMLIIAHRLNTVLSCDKILVMDNGKVQEFDRPSILMAKSDSVFRTMLEASEGSGLN